MTVFLVASAVLTLLTLVAVLWPLWHGSRRFFLSLLATLGIGTALLYQWVGTPAAINAAPPVAAAPYCSGGTRTVWPAPSRWSVLQRPPSTRTATRRCPTVPDARPPRPAPAP